MLIDLKAETPYREFQTRVSEIGIDQRQSSRLMTLARNVALLEQAKPDSQRAVLVGRCASWSRYQVTVRKWSVRLLIAYKSTLKMTYQQRLISIQFGCL